MPSRSWIVPKWLIGAKVLILVAGWPCQAMWQDKGWKPGVTGFPRLRQECPGSLHASWCPSFSLSFSDLLLFLPFHFFLLSIAPSLPSIVRFFSSLSCSEMSLSTAFLRPHSSKKCSSYSGWWFIFFCKIICNGEDWIYLVIIIYKANVDWMFTLYQADTIQNDLPDAPHLILTITQWGNYYYFPQFSEEASEALRG